MNTTTWHGCYDASWKSVITNASFAHPAKFSRGLIERIFDHCLAKGYLKPGDTVGDCFGGIGTGGITAAYRGLSWIGCELEPRFVEMAEDNFKLHQHRWDAMGKPWPRIIQGDSRAFHVLLGEDYEAMVSSPPYAQSVHDGNGIDWDKAAMAGKDKGNHRPGPNSQIGAEGYGRTAGQIGSLSAGAVDSVITSPPYADSIQRFDGDKKSDAVIQKWFESYRAQGGGMGFEKFKAHVASGRRCGMDVYGAQAGQIGALHSGAVEAVVSSPPWEDEVAGGCPGSRLKVPPSSGKGHAASLGARERQAQRDEQRVYGTTAGQIGQLKGGSVDAVATSPPYVSGGHHADQTGAWNKNGRGQGMTKDDANYGSTPGQIGRESPETYWQAMRQVYESCHKAIKPGGFLILVLKDYVKGGKRVPLCDDTCRLIEHIGFEVIERIQAMLVSETSHGDLFTGTDTKTKSRKSFFRRLAEKKGSPKIDFEEVIIAQKK